MKNILTLAKEIDKEKNIMCIQMNNKIYMNGLQVIGY